MSAVHAYIVIVNNIAKSLIETRHFQHTWAIFGYLLWEKFVINYCNGTCRSAMAKCSSSQRRSKLTSLCTHWVFACGSQSESPHTMFHSPTTHPRPRLTFRNDISLLIISVIFISGYYTHMRACKHHPFLW